LKCIDLVTAEALVHWLRSVKLSKNDRAVLTEALVVEYAQAYDREGYFRNASDRGVIVVRIDRTGPEGTPLHYLYHIFEQGTEVPVFSSRFKSELLMTKRLLRDYIYAQKSDIFAFGRAIYSRRQDNHGAYTSSLASTVLGLPESSRPGAPNRNDMDALLMRVASIDLAHQSLLFHPQKPASNKPRDETPSGEASLDTPVSSSSASRSSTSPSNASAVRLDFNSN